MSNSHYEEMSGRNARENTALLMRSIKDLVKEAGENPFTQPPGTHKVPQPTRNVEGLQTPPTMTAAPLGTQPTIKPVVAAPPEAPKKSVLGRLFG